MANKTACSQLSYFYTACNVDDKGRKCNSFIYAFNLSIFVIIAVLSPLAVAGNTLILVAIWKRTFVRTPFHILLSGLAFTDLCTGLIAQPFVTVNTFSSAANPGIVREKPLLTMTLLAIGDVSATYFIAITILLITLMSVERWLHMSRRSLITSRRRCFTIIISPSKRNIPEFWSTINRPGEIQEICGLDVIYSFVIFRLFLTLYCLYWSFC